MKTILYMATTINGIIAKNDDSAEFLTPVEAKSYCQTVIDAGAIIVGRRTYEVLSEQPEFQEFLDAGVKVVAVSQEGNLALKHESHLIAKSPSEALEALKDHPNVVIAGGGELNASFMGEGLVDEIYIDVEPAIVGEGIPLFKGKEFETQLEFIGHKMLSDNEIQLHYKVVK